MRTGLINWKGRIKNLEGKQAYEQVGK